MRYFEIVNKYKEKVDDTFKMPFRGTKGSAGYDIFNNTGEDIILNPGEISKPITTFLKSHFQEDEVLQLYPRSSHGFKFSLKLANTVGIIDHDYAFADNDGEIFIKLHNQSNTDTLVIKDGEAMVQGIFTKYLTVKDDHTSVGGKRTGGFGSTN